MSRDRIAINGVQLSGEHGPETIVGTLVRRILECTAFAPNGTQLHRLSEMSALIAARDVLLACNRTQSGGDTYMCVDALCRAEGLMVLCPDSAEAEPVAIEVEFRQSTNPYAATDGGDRSLSPNASQRGTYPNPPHGGKAGRRRSFAADRGRVPGGVEKVRHRFALSPTLSGGEQEGNSGAESGNAASEEEEPADDEERNETEFRQIAHTEPELHVEDRRSVSSGDEGGRGRLSEAASPSGVESGGERVDSGGEEPERGEQWAKAKFFAPHISLPPSLPLSPPLSLTRTHTRTRYFRRHGRRSRAHAGKA
mmetsp:Transcript_5604/g.12768  ORF Transcript_5604/g.12768 Transcript_5604/m.12768 type:complete len:310 (-) Transcript_5604:2834-3763(-)